MLYLRVESFCVSYSLVKLGSHMSTDLRYEIRSNKIVKYEIATALLVRYWSAIQLGMNCIFSECNFAIKLAMNGLDLFKSAKKLCVYEF